MKAFYLHKGLNFLLLMSLLISKPVLAATDEDMPFDELQAKSVRNQWIKIKENRLQNITVWYKIEDGKNLRSFKVEALIDASYEDTARAIVDADNVHRWFWECLESKLLKKVSDTEYYAYLKVNFPQPFPDRDNVVHITIDPYSPQKGYSSFKFQAVPNYLPINPKIIRIQTHDFVIKLTPISKEKTKMETEGFVDPSGHLPIWMINHVQRYGAYQTILGLIRHVKQGHSNKFMEFKLVEDEVIHPKTH